VNCVPGGITSRIFGGKPATSIGLLPGPLG
jgi:hypothetical protein